MTNCQHDFNQAEGKSEDDFVCTKCGLEQNFRLRGARDEPRETETIGEK